MIQADYMGVNLEMAVMTQRYSVTEYVRVVLCDSFDCELLKNSQIAIIRILQSKPDLLMFFFPLDSF